MPVAISDLPRPSRSTATSMAVSLVARLTAARRPRRAARAAARPVLETDLRPRAIATAWWEFGFAPFYQGFGGFATGWTVFAIAFDGSYIPAGTGVAHAITNRSLARHHGPDRAQRRHGRNRRR